jgi:hypothetical protein
MERKLFMLAVAVLIASGPAFAQQTQPNQPDPTVNQRKDNQQDRIANGVDSGQLTAGETKNLEGREANLNREVKDDRSADNGKLTQQEHQQINRQQNHLSNSIYQDKHNANTAHYGNNEVGQRRENQQHRQRSCTHRKSRAGHQPAGSRRSFGEWWKVDRTAEGADQSRAEWRQPPDLSPEAQRQIVRR